MSESNGIRTTYDQRWQSTFKELVAQREQHQREILALHARLTAVAEELVWHKYAAFLPFALVLLCCGCFLFARSGPKQTMMIKVPRTSSRAVLNRSAAAPLARNRTRTTLFEKRTRRSEVQFEQMDMGASPAIRMTTAHGMKDNRRVRLELPMSLIDMDHEDDLEDSPDDDLLMDISD